MPLSRKYTLPVAHRGAPADMRMSIGTAILLAIWAERNSAQRYDADSKFLTVL